LRYGRELGFDRVKKHCWTARGGLPRKKVQTQNAKTIGTKLAQVFAFPKAQPVLARAAA